MENFDFKKYLSEGKLLKENSLKNDINDFIDSIDIDNYQRSKDNDPDFENVNFDMEFFLDMYPEYAGKEEEIQQILNNKDDLAEEIKKFGRSNYEVQIDEKGKFIEPYGEKEYRKIYLLNDKGEEKSTAEIEAELGIVPKDPSDDKAERYRAFDDLTKYGKFGQTRRQFRKEKD